MVYQCEVCNTFYDTGYPKAVCTECQTVVDRTFIELVLDADLFGLFLDDWLTDNED